MDRPHDALDPDEMARWDAAMRRAEEPREREPEPPNDPDAPPFAVRERSARFGRAAPGCVDD